MVPRLKIFLSSPGDVGVERALARRAIARVQGAFRGRVELVPVLWENEPLVASEGFQTQIERPSQCDIVAAILWSRIGTPLPRAFVRPDGTPYQSGTEFEIEDALAAARAHGRPQVLLYRKTAPPPPAVGTEAQIEAALAQRRALGGFLDRILHEKGGAIVGASRGFATASQFDELFEEHLTRLVARLVPEGEADMSAARWSFGSPFRGLASFEPEHAPIFFGRTAAIGEAIERLRREASEGRPFLLVVGASGLGKSSLVKAGLLPLLIQPGVIEGVAHWRYGVMRPADAGGAPLLSLIAALRRSEALPSLLADTSLERFAQSGDMAGLAARVAAALAPYDAEAQGAAHLLLVVDQLEELMTDDKTNEAQREGFALGLKALMETGRAWIIASLRSDFYPAFAASPGLIALKGAAGQFDLEPPTREEIGQLIRLPTISAGLAFETDKATGQPLDELLREAALKDPSSLPLLEFTLEELYRARSPDGILTFAAYRALGELEGSLGRRAETVFSALPKDAEEALPAILNALVRIEDDEARLGRRRVPLAGFADAPARALVEAFIEARLFVSELSANGAPSVTLAHEALLTHWPRVRQWVEENRDLLRMRSRLESAGLRWLAEGRRSDYLLAAGKPLSEARSVVAAGLELTPDERAFVALSDRRAQRNRAIRIGAVAGLVVLGVSASIAAVIATQQAKEARTQARTAGQTSDFLVSLFTEADPSENLGKDVTARALLDRGVARIGTALQAEPRIQASLLQSIGSAYTGLGLYEPAIANLKKAYATQLKLAGPRDAQTMNAGIVLATAYYQEGDFDSAEKILREVIAAGSGGHDMMRAHKMLGLALLDSGDPRGGLEELQNALSLLDKSAPEAWADEADIEYGIGGALVGIGSDKDAKAALEQALALRSAHLPAGHPQIVEVRSELAWVKSTEGDNAGAEADYRSIVTDMEKIYGDNHPEVSAQLNNLGRVILMQGRFAEAIADLSKSVVIEEKSKGALSADLMFPLNSLGQAFTGVGSYDQAMAALSRARDLAAREKSWLLGPILTNLCDLANRRGDYAGARQLAAEARAALLVDFPPTEDPSDRWRFDLLDGIEAETAAGLGEAGAAAQASRSLAALSAAYPQGGLYVEDARARLKRIAALRPKDAAAD